ncbi:PilZ domain-containing protein [Salinisphaera sp. LB1]|uniref:PilZ domain-containing protein n=1 Tax=Salinisphaera sp. LB1 TaxID=2183911 RepID=UPI000D70783D|nr:PilZ domain-containing protein [Salinisphaera sp. LB1]AWN17367.1 Type IV pilus biogenesis protein PilZ [Salinisphaera sp. LB1]
MSDNSIAGQSGIVRFDVPSNRALYEAYMPFIRNGGLFVGQPHLLDMHFDLGAEVFLLLHLKEQDERVTVAGRIVWVSLPGTQRPPGIGVQFAEPDGIKIQQRIETLLAGQLESERPTHTL